MFRQFRSEVADALGDALASLDLPTDDLGIERPPDDMDATLASSVAFRLAGEVGDAPPNVAATVADAVDVDGYDYLAAVDTAGPYVNFHPGERYCRRHARRVRGRLGLRRTSRPRHLCRRRAHEREPDRSGPRRSRAQPHRRRRRREPL